MEATVSFPGGASYAAETILSADQWSYVTYPDDFSDAPALPAAVFTVLWEINGGVVACDGFVVTQYDFLAADDSEGRA